MSWLDFVLSRFVPFCLAVMINSKHSDQFAFRRSHNILRIHENRKRIDPAWLSFLLDLSGKVSHSKAFHSFKFSLSFSPHKYQKSLWKTTLISLNRKIVDQTVSTIIHVSWSKLFGARLERYQQEFCRKFTPSEQMCNDKLYRSRYSEQLQINKCWLLIVPFSCSWSK